MRILGVTTTYFSKSLAMEKEALHSVTCLDTTGVTLDWLISTENPFGVDPGRATDQNIAFKLEKARRLAIAGKYDYMFLHEHDVILPVDTIQRLIGCRSDVALGVYRLRPAHGMGSDICLFSVLPKPVNRHGYMLHIALDLQALGDFKVKIYEKKRFRVAGGGLGCVLIHRDVFRKTPFKYHARKEFATVEGRQVRLGETFDIQYFNQVHVAGFKVVCDGAVQCEHKEKDSIIYQIGGKFWESTLVYHEGVWSKFSKIVPLKPLTRAKLHLGSTGLRRGAGWMNFDVDSIPDVNYAAGMNVESCHLPFENDFFSEIEVTSPFLERMQNRKRILDELWRVALNKATVRVSVIDGREPEARENPEFNSQWYPGTFERVESRFTLAKSMRKRPLIQAELKVRKDWNGGE